MQVRILWAVVGGFLVGVFARSFLQFGWWTIVFVGLCGVFTLAVAFAARMEKEKVIVAATLLCAIAAGAARMHAGILEGDPALDVWLGEKVVIEGVVADEPDERENGVRVPVHVLSVASTTVDRNMRVLVIAPLHAPIAYGDRVRATGTLRLPEAFDSGTGRQFNYPAYLAKDGIGYELAFAQIKKTGEGPRNPLKTFAIYIKNKYLEGLGNALAEPEAGLAGGITAGDKRALGSELNRTFRTVGLIHIVVLSGYNIMIVIYGIEKVLWWTRQWIRSLIGIIVAMLFALMTGLASSSVRAAAMAVIATTGKTTGRIYMVERALGVVAFLMVLWNPYVLAFDPSFQLSFLATLGLIFISPLFAVRLGWMTERLGLRETAAATLGTQTAVLPLLLYQNGMLSIYSLPTNLLALAAVPYAMLLAFIAGVIGLFAGPLAPIIGFPAYVLLWYITAVAKFFASLPFSAVAIPAFSALWLFAIYALLVVGYVFTQKKAAKP